MLTDNWTTVKALHPIGSLLEGVVEYHAPFGVFVDIGQEEIRGLVLLPEFNDEGSMHPAHYPPVGSKIVGLVLDYTPDNNQIRLSVRPSKLRRETV